MICASCGRANQPGARFCGGCGVSLAPRCPACGAAGEHGARFCQACGAFLAGPEREDPAARKVVTIVFADLKGSTPLQERLDPESSQRFMDRYHDAMRAEVEAERGVVTQLLGDGVKAVFGVPRVAEDDALRAVRAGLAMQRAFRKLLEAEAQRVGEIGLRVAVNTGEVVASAEREIIGDPVTVAAQLQQEARVGDVVIAEPTRRLVAELVTLAPLGAFAVKGRAERVPAYRVVSLERPAGAAATAFVGRESELARIRAVFDDAVAKRAARLAVILGSPGLGKSRLIGEVARRLAESATVLSARCDSAGGATFAPVAAALRAQLGSDDGVSGEALHAAIHAATSGDAPERTRVAAGIAALLAGTPASHQETFFVVRRFLAGVAAERPAVLVLDDLQWAEPLLLDLVEHLIQWSANTPLLVLVGARPELREARSSLTAPGELVAEVVTLAGLDAAAATRLAANAIGADELPAAVAGRVLTASEGNPLFVGELVRMLVQDGVLVREGERWTTDAQLSALQMPPTIQALLAARIERLRPDERTVLERAAVIGRQFSRAALAELLPREVADLDRVLEALRRSELVESDSGWFLGEPALRFHHVLTRDAAYRRLLKNRRAELHERFADWVLRRVGDEAPHDETIGWHLEQAHQHLSELGPLDPHGRELGERAARTLGAAGRRALERDDLPLAASLLGRAVARLDEDDPARAELALDWCEALLSAGEVAAAAAAIDEFGRFAHLSPRLRAWHTCFAGQRAALTDPDSLRATVGAVSAAAEALAAEGDTAGEAKGHLVHAQALARLGRMGACEAALDRAQAAARRMHDRRRANTVLAAVPLAVLAGPSPVTRASGRCLDVVRVLRITQGSPAVEAVALQCQGVLEALRGRSEAARRMVASSRRMVEELGITHRLLEADVFAGRIELIEGDAAAAERCLRPAYEGLRAQGLHAAQAAALLARALLELGRVAEAEALSHESEKLAGDALPANIAWRCVRAEALARRGEHATAVELAQAAVQLAAVTDVLLDHADARLALAAALRAAGRGGEAAAEEARAIELWEAKGATRLAERARRAVGRIAEPPQRAPEAPLQSRRVLHNYATDHMRRLDAAVVARDRAKIASLMVGDIEMVDHVSGRHFGVDSILALFSQILERSDRLAFVNQPIAALGSSLALAHSVETASELVSGDLPVGAYEIAYEIVLQADASGRCVYLESFASDRLGDAVARLYERYAETLPDGPERARANAAARAVGALIGTFDLARYADSFAPGIEYRDRRGAGDVLVGRAAVLQWLQTLPAIADDVSNRFDDVLASSPDSLLLRLTNSGTERAGKSRFERSIVWLGVFSAEGIAAIEVFEGERDAEALARFDELARPASAPVRRRVPSNPATASAERFVRAVAARDVVAVEAMHSERIRNVLNPTGVVLGQREILDWWRLFFRDREATLQLQPLAVLGDALALQHQSWRGSAAVDDLFAVGPFQQDSLAVHEIDATGRFERLDDFALDRLGDALVRLYERYAELQPEGSARERAAATARAFAAFSGPMDLELAAAVRAPDVLWVDRRTLGLDPAHGIDAFRRMIGSLVEAAPDASNHIDDVLDARPEGWVLRLTNSGTDRRTGGAYESCFLMLAVFGPDGRVFRNEMFDPDREAEALARFDELVARPSPIRTARRRKRTTVVSDQVDRLNAAFAARDADALAPLLAEGLRVVDHKSGAVVDAQGIQSWLRLFLGDHDAVVRLEPLAVLSDSLVLNHLSWSGSASNDPVLAVGAFDASELDLVELEAGLAARVESFATDRLGEAIVRLYERYAELQPEGPARDRAAAISRALVFFLGPVNLEHAASIYAPHVELVDRRVLGLGSTRGVAEVLRLLESLVEAAPDASNRVEEILDARPDAWLMRLTNFGTDRRTGGAFERTFLRLIAFGADGRVIHHELFDVEREAEALARFDELRGEAAAPPARRSMRANAATAWIARSNAAIAASDESSIEALHADDVTSVVHTSGIGLSRPEILAWWRLFFRDRGEAFSIEPVAVLGGSLALGRQRWSASASTDETFPIGAFEADGNSLFEVDRDGRARYIEVFVPGHLGQAIVRLYERYAELLPEGPARQRAAVTARHIASANGPLALEHIEATYAPDIEHVDHRRTIGLGTTRGRDAFLRTVRALLEAAPNASNRTDDILGAQPDALLRRVTNSGTDRDGGAFERVFLMLTTYGADGRVARAEQFDPDAEAEAVARFDELTGAPAARPARRPVRPNAATAWIAASNAAIAASDESSIEALHADDVSGVIHTSGIILNRAEILAWWRLSLRERDEAFSIEPVAVLGDSLALGRQTWSASASSDETFPIGAFEADGNSLFEVDRDGRARYIEVFVPGHLGQAIVRLYERYAEQLSAGPARARAAATARTVGAIVGPFDLARRATAFAPDIDYVDHRTQGVGTLRGREPVVEWLRTLLEVAENVVFRHDDVLALRPDALLMRWSNVGRERAGGGSYERNFLWLGQFSHDGLLARIETFEPERELEALARFDELTANPAPPWFANAATRAMERMTEAWNARNWPAIEACYAPEARLFDRLSVGMPELDRAGLLEFHRAMFEMESSLGTAEVLATRGERLALGRILLQVSSGDVGASEVESVNVVELNERGQRVAMVRFDPNDLDAAYAELDRRYTEWQSFRYDEVGPAIVARDWDAVAAGVSPEVVVSDHRSVGFETIRGVAAYIESLRALVELAPDARLRLDHVRISGRARLSLTTWVGTREGGDFEAQRVVITEIDQYGRACCFDFYEPEQIEMARAHFESIARSHLHAIPPNAATRARDRVEEAALAADWARLRALASDDFQYLDRGRQALVDTGIDAWIEGLRFLREQGTQHRRELVATSGDRTDVERIVFARGPAAGAFELGQIVVVEVAGDGRLRAVVRFDPDDRRAAFEEAARRFVEGEAAGVASQAVIAAYSRAFARSDIGSLRACLADDFVVDDLRSPSVFGALDRDEWLESVAALTELAPDFHAEVPRIMAWNERGAVQAVRIFGTREGGPFENLFVRVLVTDGERVLRVELFGVEDTERALARFAELC